MPALRGASRRGPAGSGLHRRAPRRWSHLRARGEASQRGTAGSGRHRRAPRRWSHLRLPERRRRQRNLPHIEGVALLLRLGLQIENELIRPSPSNLPGRKENQRRRKAVHELQCLHCAGRHEEGLQARGCIEERREDGLTCGFPRLRYLLCVHNFDTCCS